MNRVPWPGRGNRPAGRHAAGPRGRAGAGAGPEPARADSGSATEVAPWSPGPADAGGTASAGLLAAPVMTDLPQEPLVSPVTDAARAAAAASAASLPDVVPPWAAPVVTIDALGRKCPIPIIWLAQQIGDVPVGAVIAVLADDPAAYSDIPAWCGLKSHDCVFRVDYATGWSFGIRRRY